MRKNEKHLFETPTQRLSNLSHLVNALRQHQLPLLERLANYSKLCYAIDNLPKVAHREDYDKIDCLVADLIMEAVYETRFAETAEEMKK